MHGVQNLVFLPNWRVQLAEYLPVQGFGEFLLH